jgi:hypothetical protein
MRLRIRRLLRGGEYWVLFESMGFSPEETKRIKKFGMPIVDLSTVGLGAHQLDEIRLCIKCHSAEEAAQITNRIKQSIKDKLAELSTQAAAFVAQRALRISLGGKMLVLGSACALALLLLSAYKGFIWLREKAILEEPPSATARVTVTEDTITIPDTLAFLEADRESPQEPEPSFKKDKSEDALPPVYAENPSKETSPDSRAAVKADFTPTATDNEALPQESREPPPGPVAGYQKDESEEGVAPAYAQTPSKQTSLDSQIGVKPDFAPAVTDTEALSQVRQESSAGSATNSQEDETEYPIPPADAESPSKEESSDSRAVVRPDFTPAAADTKAFSEESQEPPPGLVAGHRKDESEEGVAPASDKGPSPEPNSDSEALAKPDLAPAATDTAVFSEESREPLPGPPTSYEKEETEDSVVLAYAKGPSKEADFDSRPLVKPDFTLTAVPESLLRYSDLEAELAESGPKTNRNRFDLLLTPWGGFKGPVALEVSGSSPLIEEHLSPREIETLPGTSVLRISLSPGSPPEIRANITVTARGKTPSGHVITHQKRLVAIFRQSLLKQGRVWRVSTQGSDLSGEGAAESPFRTIQKAIDCARAGDTVLVERGRYEENVNVTKRDWILIASHFILDLEESTVGSTIIEPAEPGWVMSIGESEQVTIRGFTIQKGRGEKDCPGGGIYCYDSSPNILDNIVTENENHSGYGAGICCYGCAPTILRNHITKNCNYDGRGAGIYCYKSDPDIEHNIISGNYSSGGGSGIHLLEPNWVRIVRNVIHNDSGFSAMVLYNTGTAGDFQLVNNTISNNRANAIGYFGGPWSFQNNIIARNDGYGLFTFEGIAYFTHNDVWGNVFGNDTVDYYGLEERPNESNGNISEDPYFGDPARGNFHLSINSPCIDSGDPDHAVLAHGGGRIDMGAIEYVCPDATCGDVNRDCFIDAGDVEYLEGYVLNNGPAPHPLWIGDVDGDSSVTLGDVIYLQKYTNGPGPAPCASKDHD